ncbi:MAG: hypothetical protein ACYS0K_24725, partial [Planctomycetota bacterium]
TTFALWPSQAAEVVRGHHLRSNQYLLVRVYNEEEAQRNWTKAVMKPASTETPEKPAATTPEATEPEGTEEPSVTPVEEIISAEPPPDLIVGKLLIIRGTAGSFYIPPTGIEVVPGDGDDKYVRDALTLERLEYAILIDEDGNKRFEKGPQVVFPLPTERFFEIKGEKKFRAIELNEIQGLHIKVIAPYRDENGKEHKEGDELFITGKDTAIYFPREEHSAIKYDGQAKHFATAIPAGEARYVMNRLTGEITMVKGPAMLLPDPRTSVIVRRVLSDKQCERWYPGNYDALEYNRGLRAILQRVPTTRSGAISEGDFARNMSKSAKRLAAPVAAASAVMESSQVSRDQALIAEEFTRASSYTQPRTVTLDTKFEGVPAIDVWTGYAIMIVSKTGSRRVEHGPTTVLLEYDESLEVLELSTGKPKTTDERLKTVYLRVENNGVSDIVTVETADHVEIQLYLRYRVNFESDPVKWFAVENYIKFLCDHVRSVLKGQIRKIRVEDFYQQSTDHIRDIILGTVAEGERSGMTFKENGMRVTDVEVLKVALKDDKIRMLLDHAQHEVVRANIEVSSLRRGLEVTQEKEAISREESETRAQTQRQKDKLDVELAASSLAVVLAKVANQLQEVEKQRELVESQAKNDDFKHDARLSRVKRERDQELAFAATEQTQQIELLKAEAEAVVQRFSAAQEGFSE